MPPINQGSRAALITWTVIMSVLFVVVTVLAFFANSDAAALRDQLAADKAKYEKVASENDLAGTGVIELGTAKDELTKAGKATANSTLLNVALAQRNDLAAKIAPGGGASAALTAADNAIAGIKTSLPTVTVPPGPLTEVIAALTKEIESRNAQVAAAEAEKADTIRRLEAATKENTDMLAAKDAEIAAINAEKAKIQDDANNDRGAKDAQVAEIVKGAADQTKTFEESATALQAQVSQLNQQIKERQGQIAALNNKLGEKRLPVDQVAKQGDGTIIKTPGANVVYVNLGAGDQVAAGLTFEVYDRIEGIPAIGDPANDDNLPRGKASIEVVRVQPGSSECRIVRTTPGATVVEGDLVVNMVYDKNVKYQFVVYGNFDLDRNGNSTPTDADVLKRLVTQWGGTTADKVTPDTDFIVVGTQPVVPSFSDEDLANPINQAAKDKAEADLKAYDDLIARAVELRIPIMNQNRFLYFCGYYQQSAQ